MPSDKSNVYIDTSFFDVSENDKNIDTEYTFKPSDLEGSANYRLDVQFVDIENSSRDAVDSKVVLSLVDLVEGVYDLYTEYERSSYSYNQLDLSAFFSIFSTRSGTDDFFVDFYRPTLSSGLSTYVDLSYIAGEYFKSAININTIFWFLSDKQYLKDLDIEYVNYTGRLTSSGNPLVSYDGYFNYDLEYGIGSGTGSLLEKQVDLFFAGWIFHNTTADVFSTLMSKYIYTFDIKTESKGNKKSLDFDCFSSALNKENFVGDIYSSLVDYYELDWEIITISGTKRSIDSDVFSVSEDTLGFGFDVGIFPIYFDNFTFVDNDYVFLNSSICIDIHDPIYGIDTYKTYYKIKDSVISGSLFPISDGYTMCFYPQNYLDLFEGFTKITVHAENYNSDVLEENYYLTSGYIVNFNNKKRIGLNYGYEQIVDVRMEAEDLAESPTFVTDGYWFVSEGLRNRDLQASISVLGGFERDDKNLTASIYPNSTVFFYDKEFVVEIDAKDFEGNSMETQIINFKI